ncbi:MAG TPA: LUD domain-containing protein, partial [Rectinema sp.]|nr:LUD domain-containing protein [Rectinema sp.]
MDELHAKLYQARGLRTVSALQKNAFDALYVSTAAEATEKVLEFIYEGAKVGFGGSMTIKSMNIQELAAKKGAIILDHNKPGLGADEKMQILRSQLTCDVFISS